MLKKKKLGLPNNIDSFGLSRLKLTIIKRK